MVLLKKKELLRLAGQRCFYCGVTLTKPLTPRELGRQTYPKGFKVARTMFTWDHLVPKSKGGTEKVASCVECNETKGLLTLEEFRVITGLRLNMESWWTGSYVFPGEATP